MSDPVITCPHCGKPVELTSALRHQLESDYSQRFAAQEAKLKEQLELEKKQLTVQLRAELERSAAKEVTELSTRLKEKEEQLVKAEQLELTLRKRQREIEERERRQELEVQRRIDSMRGAVAEQTRKQIEEISNVRLQEKDKQLEQLKKTIQELRQQSEQVSMQVQGDAAETSLKEQLKQAFPSDRIEDVATGAEGADLLQRVMYGERIIGTIIWESKRTRAFSEPWLSKLKKDQTVAKADLAVLVTTTLPKETTTFTERSGIWICGAEYALPLARVLRAQVILLAKSQLATQDRSTKTQRLYHYISGVEFRNRVEQLVVTFVDMQHDLDRESRALAVAMKRRQKQLESLLFGTAGMYGDLQGIIGGALPRIDQLELADGEIESVASAPTEPATPVVPAKIPRSLFEPTEDEQ